MKAQPIYQTINIEQNENIQKQNLNGECVYDSNGELSQDNIYDREREIFKDNSTEINQMRPKGNESYQERDYQLLKDKSYERIDISLCKAKLNSSLQPEFDHAPYKDTKKVSYHLRESKSLFSSGYEVNEMNYQYTRKQNNNSMPGTLNDPQEDQESLLALANGECSTQTQSTTPELEKDCSNDSLRTLNDPQEDQESLLALANGECSTQTQSTTPELGKDCINISFSFIDIIADYKASRKTDIENNNLQLRNLRINKNNSYKQRMNQYNVSRNHKASYTIGITKNQDMYFRCHDLLLGFNNIENIKQIYILNSLDNFYMPFQIKKLKDKIKNKCSENDLNYLKNKIIQKSYFHWEEAHLYMQYVIEDKQNEGWGCEIRNEIYRELYLHMQSNLFNALYEAMLINQNLIDYCKSERTFTVVLLVVDILFRSSTRLKEGYYRILLCKDQQYTDTNSYYEEENVLSMINNTDFFPTNDKDKDNMGVGSNFYLMPKSNSKYQISFYHDYEGGYSPIGLNKDQKQNTLYFTTKSKADSFTFEKLDDEYYILVNKYSDDKQNQNLGDTNSWKILALNNQTNKFVIIPLEIAQVKEYENYLYKFKFKPNPYLNTIYCRSKDNYNQINHQDMIMKIYSKLISFGSEIFKDYYSCVVYKRFTEFLSFRKDAIVRNEFIKILSDENYINSIKDHFSCSLIYQTIIYRKFYQYLWGNSQSYDHNMLNTDSCKKFLNYIYDCLDCYSKERNISKIIYIIVRFIDHKLISKFVDYILENFEEFWSTDQGIELSQLVYEKFTEPKILYDSLKVKLVDLSCNKSYSFIIEKFFDYCSPRLRQQIYEIITIEYKDSKPVFRLIGSKSGNYVIQKILKRLESEKYQGYIENNEYVDYYSKIINKIREYYEKYYYYYYRSLKFLKYANELIENEKDKNKKIKVNDLKHAEKIYYKFYYGKKQLNQ